MPWQCLGPGSQGTSWGRTSELSLEGWPGTNDAQSGARAFQGRVCWDCSVAGGLNCRVQREVRCEVGLGSGTGRVDHLRTVGVIRKILTISDNLALHFYQQENMALLFWNVFSGNSVVVTGCSEHTKKDCWPIDKKVQLSVEYSLCPGLCTVCSLHCFILKATAKEGGVFIISILQKGNRGLGIN